MRFHNKNHQQALQYVKERRDISPNTGFLRQLYEYELNLYWERLYISFNASGEVKRLYMENFYPE